MTFRNRAAPSASNNSIALVAATAAFAASLGVIGSDVLWAVPLGREIAHGRLPEHVPFATAPSAGWHDVPAGAELVLWSLYHAFGGYRGLVVGQVVGAAAGFGALAAGIRAEASDAAVLVVSGLVLAGSLPAVVVTAISAASVACFPLLLWLVHTDERRPGRRIWLAVPLLALWGNLHGGVLAGWALLACYTLLSRARGELANAVALLAAGTAALFLNASLWHTPAYYGGVFGTEVARRGTDLWAGLGTGPLDVLLIAAAVALTAIALLGRARVALWEAVALVGLAVATIHVARTGVWFLCVAAYPASRGLHLPALRPALLGSAAAVVAAGAGLSLARGPHAPGSTTLAAVAARTGQPVLAGALLAQQVAEAGGTTWISNPIDAFRRRDQRLYLDWLAGLPAGAAAVAHARYVLVATGSAAAAAAAADRRLAVVQADGAAVLYRRR